MNNIVTNFDSFIKENKEEEDLEDDINYEEDIHNFLYSFDNIDLDCMVNDFVGAATIDSKSDLMEDILLEIGDELSDEEYNWVSNGLQNEVDEYAKKLSPKADWQPPYYFGKSKSNFKKK